MTIEPAATAEAGRDFIRDIIQADLDSRKHSLIVTQSPNRPIDVCDVLSYATYYSGAQSLISMETIRTLAAPG